MTDPTIVLPEWQTCGATASFAMFGGNAGPCHLAAGHDGMHDTGSGVRWLLTMPNPEETTETRLLREAHRVVAEVTAERDRLAARVVELEAHPQIEVVWLTTDDEGNHGVWLDPDRARQQLAHDRAAETPGVYEWVNDADRTRELLLRDGEPTGLTLRSRLPCSTPSWSPGAAR
jgi:hypothetical protein